MSVSNLDRLYNHSKTGDPTAYWRLKLQKIMHNNAGVYRNQDLLSEGCSMIHDLAMHLRANLKVCII